MTAPIVLIPGQLLTAALWEGLSLGAPVIHAANSTSDTIAGMAEAILAAAPPRFALVGHAMGGFVAFEILRRAPARVDRLVLMSTLAPADTPVQTARREGYLRLVRSGSFDQVIEERRRREGYLRLVRSGSFDQVIEERLPILLSPGRRGDPALIGRVRSMALETGPDAFIRQQRAIMSRADSRADLPLISCPTLILFARQDGIVTLDHQIEMQTSIPGARLRIIETCGHLAPLEQPARVSEALADFL